MTTLRRLRDRARALPHRRVDRLLAALVAVEGLLELLVISAGRPPAGAAVAVLVIALATLLHRRRPLPAIVLGYGAMVVGEAGAGQLSAAIGPFVALIGLTVSAAGRLDTRRFAVGLVAAAALTVLSLAVDSRPGAGEYAFGVLLVAVAPVFLGRFLRGRAELTQALRRSAESLERDRAHRARAAVASERTRVSAEIHDAVAHALSGMVIQASAAKRLAVTDPERSRAALAAVEDSGREALDEMRRMLGVLRREDAELALDPQPGLARLAALVRRSGEAGLPVELEVGDDLPRLAPGVDLTAYRVIQEALYGAVLGDASTARVRVRCRADRLDIAVEDDGGTRGGERPLLGVRERLAIYGGELVVEGREELGHAVRARIPLGAAA